MSTKEMSARDVRADIPPAQFHPEFGYFCPSAQLRRKLRRAAMSVFVGILIAAGAGLALISQFVPQAPGDRMPQEAALLAAAPLPTEMPADALTASMPATARTTPVADVTDNAVPSRTQDSCDQPAGAFLTPQCRSVRTGKSLKRAARAATRQAATLRIGHAELEAVPQPAPAAEAAMAATATDDEMPPLPSQRPAAPAKKPVKIAQKRATSPVIASTGPAAAPRSAGFDLFGFLHDPSRPGTGAWAMSR